VLRRILAALHPVMPFVTEELARHFTPPGDGMLIREAWPEDPDTLIDAGAAAEMNLVVKLIAAVRSIRAQYNVEPGKALTASLSHASPAAKRALEAHRDLILKLARLERIDAADAPGAGKGAIETVVDDATLAVHIAGAIDKPAELKRLDKELDRIAGEAGKMKAKLGNEGFLSKAPPEVVEELRERLAEAETASARLAEARDRLAAL
jgi:valyl-tRNA synthetase